MQITKRRLKEIIKEELKTFTLNEQLSDQGEQALTSLLALDPAEQQSIIRMIQAGQSTEY